MVSTFVYTTEVGRQNTPYKYTEGRIILHRSIQER